MPCQTDVSLSRRSFMEMGVAGVVMSGLSTLGVPLAMAEEAEGQGAVSVAADIDLEVLSDEELVVLEARVAKEKSMRGINSAFLPMGSYTTGIDFDAGTYVLTPIDPAVEWEVALYVDAEKMETSWRIDTVYGEPGKSATVSMSGTQILSTTTDCMIAPFQKLAFGQSADDESVPEAKESAANQA